MNRNTRFFTTMVLAAVACHAVSQTLSVASVEATTGGQAELVVSANDMAGVTALQFNLALPQGVTLNESAITKGNAVSNHELVCHTFSGGNHLFVLYNMDKALITNGTLMRLPITVGQQAGSFSASLYKIRTANTEAESHECLPASFNITVKAAVQPVTITADDITMTYGDDVPALTYKSSGATLNGTPKLSTTATKTSPVGTYPIKVEKGTVTNEQVTYVDGTLTIGKAPLTVGVQNVTITEGDAIPTFTLTYSGFRNNDTESNAFTTKPTATTTATSASKPGTYPITVSGGAAQNYALTYTQGTLTITAKAVQSVTITADDKTMTYGDDVPALTYKSSGATLNGTPKLSTTATKTSPVGTYPIKVEKGTVTNELVTYVDGTLTIGKAPLTVGVQNVTITEGDAIPTFTLTYSGFRNNDTESNAFTTKPTATTTATSTSKPGTYPITVSGGAAQNYALTYTQGTLTITAKAVQSVTITADDKTMTYGDDVPALTYKSSGATLNGTPKLSTTATKTSPVGTYPIKVEKGTVTNEQVTYVDGTLTIGKAPLTVGVQNVTITEGDAIPTFTLTYSGFRNNDWETNAFTTKPTATTTATSTSKPGTYPITVSGGEAKNYALTYTQGTLTIEEKPEVLPDVSGMTKVHDLDFTQGDYYITLNENDQRGTAWETGNAKRQKIYNVATPAEMSNVLALQAAYSGESGSKGWWVRGSKGGLWCYSATRSAAVLNLSKGDIVVFESSADVANAITLTNGSGEPDGPFTFVKTRDGKAYYCTMTANGQLGFCGVKNNGYITSIKVYSNNASGIRDIKAAQSLDGEIYDLFGRKLTKPKKGFNIIGGKKVFVP